MKKVVALSLCILMPWTSFAADGGGTTPREVQTPEPAASNAARDGATPAQEPDKAATVQAPPAQKTDNKPAQAPASGSSTATPADPCPKRASNRAQVLVCARSKKDPATVAALKKYEGIDGKKDPDGKKAAYDKLKEAAGYRTAVAPQTTTPAKPNVTKTDGTVPTPVVEHGPPAGANAPPVAHPASQDVDKYETEAAARCLACHNQCAGCTPAPEPPLPRRNEETIRTTTTAIETQTGGGLGLGIDGKNLAFGLGGALLGFMAGRYMGNNNNNAGFATNPYGYAFNPMAPRYALPGAYPAPGGFGLGGPFGGGPLGGGLFGRQLPNSYPAPGGAAFGAGSQFGFGYGGGIYGQMPIQGVGGGLYGAPAMGPNYGTPMIGNPTIGAGGAPIALPFPGPSTGGGYAPFYQQGVNGGIIYNGAR